MLRLNSEELIFPCGDFLSLKTFNHTQQKRMPEKKDIFIGCHQHLSPTFFCNTDNLKAEWSLKDMSVT